MRRGRIECEDLLASLKSKQPPKSLTPFQAGKYGRWGYKDQAETPNTQTVLYEYEGRNLTLNFDIRPWITNVEAGIGEEWPTHGVCTGLVFYGSEGYMVLPHYAAYYTYLGKQKKKGPFAEDPTDKIKDQALGTKNVLNSV